MMLISDEYRRLNAEKHAQSPTYGMSGAKMAPAADRLARETGAKTVLDYGCGKGAFKEAISRLNKRPYAVLEYDPAILGKEGKPIRADIVVCGDVLEHIEPECIDAVLDDIRNIARIAVLLAIATTPAAKHLSDGRNTHLIVEPAEWWLPKLAARWAIRRFHDLGGELYMIGERK
jgi:2-polyprenyl-3-methyl-5-hydroxy-6-metoxy-1,4-benzoquinol methylase